MRIVQQYKLLQFCQMTVVSFSYVWLLVTWALKSHVTPKRPMTNDEVEFNN